MKQYLEAGEFVTTHGIAGELKLYPWADDAAFFKDIPTLYLSATGQRPLVVQKLRAHKNMCILKLQGVDTIEQARVYIGKTAWVSRADIKLEEGRVFVQDLLGAQVVDAESGRLYGSIQNVTRPGHHDVYEIQDEAGGVFLFPAVEEFIDKIDIAAGVVTVRPIPGMFNEGEGPA